MADFMRNSAIKGMTSILRADMKYTRLFAKIAFKSIPAKSIPVTIMLAGPIIFPTLEIVFAMSSGSRILVKNKVAPPFRTAEVDIIYGEGISREGDILDLAVAENIVNKSGAWYAYNGDKIGQGRENAKLFLKEHPDLMEEVEQKVREKYAQKEGVDQVENEEKASDKTVKEPVKAAKKADDAE